MKVLIVLVLLSFLSMHASAITEENVDVAVGRTATLRLPNSITNTNPYAVTYENRAPEYVEVSNESKYSCTVKGVKDSNNRRVYVTCHYYYTKDSKPYYNIYNFAIKVTGNTGGETSDNNEFSLTEHDVTLKVGEKHQLKYNFTGTPSTVTWDWSRSGIVTLDQNGMITGKNPGNVQIYAKTSDGKYDTCNVSVITESSPNLQAGEPFEGITTEGHCLYFTVIDASQKTAQVGFKLGDSYYTAKNTTDANTLTIPSYVNGYEIVKIGQLGLCGDFMKQNFSLTLPSTLTEIEKSAFQQNPTLISVNQLPEGMKTLPQQCFDRCTSLSSIEIPSSVKTLEYLCLSGTAVKEFKVKASSDLTEIQLYAFSNCINLKELELGEKLYLIHYSAFDNCKAIEKISISNKTCPMVYGGGNLFGWNESMYEKITLYVPKESISDYKNDYQFGKFKNIRAIESSSDIEQIYDAAISSNAVYYTLQGLRIENPQHGIYIKVVGGEAIKVAIP